MQTTEQAATADAMPVPAGRLKQRGACPPCGAPGGEEARDVAGVSDSLDRRHHQVRHDPDETVHQGNGVARKKICRPQSLARHGNILSLSIAQNI
jgi:hypothetical protein